MARVGDKIKERYISAQVGPYNAAEIILKQKLLAKIVQLRLDQLPTHESLVDEPMDVADFRYRAEQIKTKSREALRVKLENDS